MRKIAYGLVGVLLVITSAILWSKRDSGAGQEGGDRATAAVAPGGILTRPAARPGDPPEAASGRSGVLGRRPSGGKAGRAEEAGIPGKEASSAIEAGTTYRSEPAVPSAPADRGAERVSIAPPPAGDELEHEIEVAAALFHMTPADFHAWIDGRGEGLHEDRRMLAMAFSAALGGGRQDWDKVRDRLARSERISAREVALFDRAIGSTPSRTVPAASGRESALEIAMAMDLEWVAAEQALEDNDPAKAAGHLSNVMLDELYAPWEADGGTLEALAEQLEVAQAGHRWNPKGDWPAVTMRVEHGDSLVAIRKRFLEQYPGHPVCTGLIDRANGIKGRYLRVGNQLRIPLDEVSMLVDLSARWAFYRFGDEVAAAWPVGIGRPERPTDIGVFVVGEKLTDPMWPSPELGMIPAGDPRNELGTRWLGWEDEVGPTSLGFHGTVHPETVGKAVSSGCVRFRNEDVEALFEILPRGSRVYVQQ